jgi:hypothetical protein
MRLVGQKLLCCYSIVSERFQQLYFRLKLRESKFIFFLIGGSNELCCLFATTFSHCNESDWFFGPIIYGVLFWLSSAVWLFGRFCVSDSDGQTGATVLNDLNRSLVSVSWRLLLIMLLIKWAIDVGNVMRLLIILINCCMIRCLGTRLRVFIGRW